MDEVLASVKGGFGGYEAEGKKKDWLREFVEKASNAQTEAETKKEARFWEGIRKALNVDAQIETEHKDEPLEGFSGTWGGY